MLGIECGLSDDSLGRSDDVRQYRTVSQYTVSYPGRVGRIGAMIV